MFCVFINISQIHKEFFVTGAKYIRAKITYNGQKNNLNKQKPPLKLIVYIQCTSGITILINPLTLTLHMPLN